MKKIIFLIFPVLFASAVLCAAQDDVSKWREWITAQQAYLDKVESLMDMSRKLALRQNSELGAAIKNKDTVTGEKVLADTTKKLSAIVDLLKALEPPAEFKEYHEKVVEAYTYRLKANEATIQKDIINIRNFTHTAMMSEIAAMESIRKLYISHDAPLQVIESIDKNVEMYKKLLASN
ncbi:MAG: hypothetical protein PHI58_02385 [Candidatus Omnitrophica bacterium]|nr:hypothetical protein [Candidatus Omnitrophota bacterium]